MNNGERIFSSLDDDVDMAAHIACKVNMYSHIAGKSLNSVTAATSPSFSGNIIPRDDNVC